MSEKAGYLGPGKITFGYMAAEKYFQKKDVEPIPFKTHEEVCDAVSRDETDFGVVAVENVIEGPVTETVYATEKFCRGYGLRICGEVELPIELFLFRKINDGSKFSKVVSHPVALRQCSAAVNRLRSEGVTIEAVESTGKAAELASQNPDFMAIASIKAEQELGLTRIEKDSIADNRNNFTRFWVVGRRHPIPTSNDKTCFLVNLEQAVPGGLYRVLKCFADRQINLLIILPIPILGKKWEYTFLLEYAGHIRDEKMNAAYKELWDSGVCVGGPLVLGSYPAASR